MRLIRDKRSTSDSDKSGTNVRVQQTEQTHSDRGPDNYNRIRRTNILQKVESYGIRVVEQYIGEVEVLPRLLLLLNCCSFTGMPGYQ